MPARPSKTQVVAKTVVTPAATPAATQAVTPAPVATQAPVVAPVKKITKVVKPVLKAASPSVPVESADTVSTVSGSTNVSADSGTVVSSEVAASEASSTEPKLSTDEVFELALKDAQNMIVAARGMVARVRELKKAADREVKESRKSTKKSRKTGTSSGPREPTGFAKPCLMKQALADFLKANVDECKDLKASDLVTRTEVTKHLNKYVIANSLRDPEDNRRILYTKDSKLSPLITLPAGVTDLTYFNLQTAIKDLFEKAPTAVDASVAGTAAPVKA
jgi:hypothetical protein